MFSVGGQGFVQNKPKSSKKKAPRNAFSYYLDDAVIELRREGKVVNKGQAVPLVQDKWKNMSPEEKSVYEARAREWKMTNRNQVKSGRLDCTGKRIDDRVNFDELLEKKRKENRQAARMEWPRGSEVCNVHFYIISFKSLFELPDEEGYQPCEVACVDYTLNEGIIRTWHRFIDPGQVKLGLGAEVKFFREATHKIPESGFEQATSAYDQVWHELVNFVRPHGNINGRLPPLYTRVAELRKTVYCLDWLSSMAGMANRLHSVYELEDIAAELFHHAGILRPSRTTIEDGCSSSMFDYERNTKCDYHDKLECIHCALLTVKKCCFWMSDALATIYGFEITDSHLPVQEAPSYIVRPPESIVIDERPRRNYNRPNPLAQKPRQPPFVHNQGFQSRDIRYRPTYEIVPHGLEEESSTSDDSSSIASSSSHSTVTNDAGFRQTSNQGSRPPQRSTIEVNRRPNMKPKVMGVMAAQFKSNLNIASGDGVSRGPPPGFNSRPGSRGGYEADDSSDASEPRVSQLSRVVSLGRGRGAYLKR